MNLVFGTDAAATRHKLNDYQILNGLKKPDPLKPNVKPPQAKAPGSADPSGLIKGLKKIVAAPVRAPYDPFMGMAKRKDYYGLRNEYHSAKYDRVKADPQTAAGGYDFQQYFDESLLRAFAGLGVFIEDEVGKRDHSIAWPDASSRARETEDIF